MKRSLFLGLLIALVVASAPVALAEDPERYYVASDYVLYGRTSGTMDDLRDGDDEEWSITEKRYRKNRSGSRVPTYDAFDDRLIFEDGSWGENLVLYIKAWHEDSPDPDEIIVQWRYQFGPVVEGTLPIVFGTTPPNDPLRVELPCICHNFQIQFLDSYRGPAYKNGLETLHIDQIYLQREGPPGCEAPEFCCEE
jgi:hypothetical protein